MGPSPFSDGRRHALRMAEMEVADLQWGHRLSAMEGAGRRSVFGSHAGPSMGPSPFSDGRLPTGPIDSIPYIAFNGAIAFQRWKVAVSRGCPSWGVTPSMGPSPFSDGRKWHRFSFNSSHDILQWGHRLSAMEGCTAAKCGFQVWCALQWGHRLSAMEGTPRPKCHISPVPFNGAIAFQRWKDNRTIRLSRGQAPSMGPSPFSDGRGGTVEEEGRYSGESFNGAIAFQRWKDITPAFSSKDMWYLQWGHRLSAMEGSTKSFSQSALRAFNGAIAFQRWKVRAGRRCWRRRLLPSMGPSPFSDGRVCYR